MRLDKFFASKNELYDLKRDKNALKMRRWNSMHFTKTTEKILTHGKKRKKQQRII